MRNNIMLVSLLVLLAVVIGLFTVYFQNSTIEKAVMNYEVVEGRNVIEKVPFADGTVAMLSDSESMMAIFFEKKLLGWRRGPGTPDIYKRVPEDEIYNRDLFAWIVLNGQTFLWGYVPPNSPVEGVRFSHEDHSYTTITEESIWYLIVPTELYGFNPKQIKVILNTGEEVPYPFEEL